MNQIPIWAVWKSKKSDLYKYIDDQIIDTKLNLEMVLSDCTGSRPVRD